MDYHPGEGYCSQLCQHPTCWKGHWLEERGLLRPVEKSICKQTSYEGLPSQKIINMSVVLDELPDSNSIRPASEYPGLPMAFRDCIFKRSKTANQYVALKDAESDRRSTEMKKTEIRTFHADELIGDWSEAILPNKCYVWVPSAQKKTSEQSRNFCKTSPVGGKMAVKTISVNTSLSRPRHRLEPSARSLRLRQKPQFSGILLMRSSKENSSFLSSTMGHNPHYVSLNDSSTVDRGSLPAVLSRAPTITFPDSSLPPHRSLSHHPLADVKTESNNVQIPEKQADKENEVDPLGKTLPPINATKYGRTRSELVKQSKLTSILLEPCFDFSQRRSWTSGMLNIGSNKLNPEPSVSATHQLDSTEDDPDFIDAQKWFKIEMQRVHSAKRSIRIPFGHQNQSSSLGNGSARPVTTSPTITPTGGITPLKKPISGLTEKSGTSAKGLTRSVTLMSPLRRTGSKVVTFAPSSRSLSSCSISLTKSPDNRRKASAISLGLERSGEVTFSKDESSHSDQPAQPPYPPPPSPELKGTTIDAEASEGPVFHADGGDSESTITITARPPTNFEDESIINTPAPSSFARSRDSTRDRLTRRASAPQTSRTEDTEGRKISISLHSKSSREDTRASLDETGGVGSAIDQLASEIVAEALTTACYILTKDDSSDTGNNKTDENVTTSCQSHVDISTKTVPDMGSKAASLLESSNSYKVSSTTVFPVLSQPNHNGLDQFDATDDDFKKELQEEYDKL